MSRDAEPPSKILFLTIRPSKAQEIIRGLARDTRNIAWSAHARERMVERDISDVVALRVLREGYVKGPVEIGGRPGEWKVKVCCAVRGRREAGVVTILHRESSLFVKTVEWED